VALEADLVVVGPRGRRTCKAEGFFVSYLTTSLGSGEVLVELRLPRATADARSAFREFSRRYGDFAIVGVAAALRIDGGGKCQSARLAVIGVGSRPVRVVSAEGVLAGEILTDGVIREAGEVAAKEVEARGDLHASSHYRRRLTAVLIEQAVTDAIQR
jgi:CO/xanthine dehydrogenase FAD-binding subunit